MNDNSKKILLFHINKQGWSFHWWIKHVDISLDTNYPVLLLLLLQLPLLELLGSDLLCTDLAHDLHLRPSIRGPARRRELARLTHSIMVLPCSLSGGSITVLLIMRSLLLPV